METSPETYHDLIVAVQIRFPGAIRGEVNPEQLDELAAKLVNETDLPGKPSVLWLRVMETEES